MHHSARGLTASLAPALVAPGALAVAPPPASAAALPTPPASAQPKAASSGASFRLVRRGGSFDGPLWVGAAPGDARGLWVAQQDGRLYRVRGGKKRLALSIASRTRAGGEGGLLGVAFHPSYRTTKLVVISSTDRRGDSRVELWRIGATASKSRLVRTLLRQQQPYSNHNGGNVTFGDGDRLYLGLGDGGSGDDPQRVAQDPSSRLGKILATTVRDDGSATTWTTVASGVRNPWRFWFDARRDELWVADVGQGEIEEVSRLPLGTSTPPNLGWSVFEGGRRNGAGDDALSGSGKLIWPAITYTHDRGDCSVTGGLVYRGKGVPKLRGRYVYGDFCSGRLWTVRPGKTGVGRIREERAELRQVTSFGTGPDGEAYATSLDGSVYRLARR